ncbi:hypothetical protein [Dermatophilus congolensis]|uniref:hypothetical protein n=1 Tax=Dermatophilus congolensis TaxID=1863 RepID=UPI0011C04550|nr:hypothetical protein [Dermatophilus congolensis]
MNGLKEGTNPSSRETVDEALYDYAVKHGVAIARERNNRSRVDHSRYLYVTDSPTGARVPRTTFHPSVEQHIAGLVDDTTNEVRSFYYVFGDDHGELKSLFASHGYVAQEFPSLLSWSALIYAFGGYITPSLALAIITSYCANAHVGIAVSPPIRSQPPQWTQQASHHNNQHLTRRASCINKWDSSTNSGINGSQNY